MVRVFAESVSGVLRQADRRLRAVAADDIHGMCTVIRRAAVGLGPVNTLYVGLYQGENTVVMPYVFSDGEDLGPETSRYGQGGLSHWVRSSGQTYRYSQDGGRICRSALPLGDGAPSLDIVAVPMFDDDGHTVIGMVNIQSLEADVFDDAFVAAAEWLTQALTVSLNIRRSASRAGLYRDFPDLDSSRLDSPVELLNAAIDRLEAVAQMIDLMQAESAGLDPASWVRRLAELKHQCRRSGAELALLAARTPQLTETDTVEVLLTSREQEIAELIARESLSNAMIAHRLLISEKTVKTHVSSILRKYDIRQRSELVWMLGARAS